MSDAVCPRCGRPARAGARFCAACGGRLSGQVSIAPVCRFCGAALRPGARYCPSCGRSAQPTEHIPAAAMLSPPFAWRRWAKVAALALAALVLAALVLWLVLQLQPVRTITTTPDIAATLTAGP